MSDSVLKSSAKNPKHDFYDSLPQHVKDDIEEGLKDVENGNLCDHEEIMAAARSKYSLNK